MILNDPSVVSGAAAILERAINSALRYDPATRLRLKNIDGTRIQVQVQNPELCFEFFIVKQEVRVSAIHETQDSDIKITGELSEFISLALQDSPSLAKLNIEISGKINLLEEIKSIANDLDIDWEAPINEIFGTVPGHALAELIRHSGNWLLTKHNSLKENLPYILTDELALLPSETELQTFYREVDEVNALKQRLDARISRLQSARSPNSTTPNS